jgi:hypothetical protein
VQTPLLFVREVNGGVFPVGEKIAAIEFGVSIKSRNLYAVIAKVDITHVVPVEVRYQVQFGLTRLEAI